MGFNLFSNTQKLATSKEDHLTEFFAGSLVLSEELRRELCDFLGESDKLSIQSDVAITNITTQASFSNFSGQPDMKLELSNGQTIIFENKIEAAQTIDSEGEPQLKRYLRLPVDGLVYVRESWKNVDEEILNAEKYIRPPHGEDHFLWRDLYPLLEGIEDPFCQWVKEGFEKEGYTPPPENIPPLYTPGGKSLKENQIEFAKYWKKTRAWAKRQGWKTGKSSRKDLRLHSHPEKPRIRISPSNSHSAKFIIQIDVPDVKKTGTLKSDLENNIEVDIPLDFEQKAMRRQGGNEDVIRVKTSLNKIIEGLENQEIEDALFGYVTEVLRHI